MQVNRTAARAMRCMMPCMRQHVLNACSAPRQQQVVARLAATVCAVRICSGVLVQQQQLQQPSPAAVIFLESMGNLHVAAQRSLLQHSCGRSQQPDYQAFTRSHSSSASIPDRMHTSSSTLQLCRSSAACVPAAAPAVASGCCSNGQRRVTAWYNWHSTAAQFSWLSSTCRTHNGSAAAAESGQSYSSSSSSSSSGCDGGDAGSSNHLLDDIHSITADTINSGKLPDWSSGSRSSSNLRGKVVAVAVSGGVDSAVSALLLKRLGYKVFGVYMHNWDASDEAGSCAPACTSAADLEDAKQVCAALGMPLYEADFVSQYWNRVFAAFLEGLEQGLTPNPDLACNSHIKFGALLQFAKQKGADVLATGHYARMAWRQPPAAGDAAAAAANPPSCVQEQQPVLLAGADPQKDQTYFLAGLNQQQLASAMFPVGHLSKADVRRIAAAAQLPMAHKRSSAGICFIGRRSFGRFLEDYLPPKPGVYVDVDTNSQLGSCSNMLAVTVGQRAMGLAGQQERVYVAGKDLGAGVIHVARGREHPALYSSRVLLLPPNWISTAPSSTAAAAAAKLGTVVANSNGSSRGTCWIKCSYRARYRQPPAACRIRPLLPGEQFAVSRYCGSWQAGTAAAGAEALQQDTQISQAAGITSAGLTATVAAAAVQQQQWWWQEGSQQQGSWVAELAEPLRGITPGQMFVLYNGQTCLGSAMIAAHGPTMAEHNQ